ncbi:TPA: hypothetical protein MIS81_25415 [Klebsiella pneumoniae]|nr:hypothetical protein FAO31_24980 [Klebsiella pneumoniae subsp. pneumoniae]HBY3692431.1 hypothetical protein [Klebsiella pneumoniae]
MMSLWDALRMNMMISYQELVRTFLSTHCPPPFSVSITLFKGSFVLTSIHSPVFPKPLPPCASIVRRTCTHTSVFGMGVIFQLPPPLIFFISTRKIKVCILYYLRLYINH